MQVVCESWNGEIQLVFSAAVFFSSCNAPGRERRSIAWQDKKGCVKDYKVKRFKYWPVQQAFLRILIMQHSWVGEHCVTRSIAWQDKKAACKTTTDPTLFIHFLKSSPQITKGSLWMQTYFRLSLLSMTEITSAFAGYIKEAFLNGRLLPTVKTISLHVLHVPSSREGEHFAFPRGKSAVLTYWTHC